MVLLILAVVWAMVLVPPALRARAEGRPADSISHFRRQLSTLQRTEPRWGRSGSAMAGRQSPVAVAAPPARHARSPMRATPQSSAQKRRRDILVGLLAAMVISLVLGAVPSLRVLWIVHVLADVLFVGYVALLVRMRNAVAEREMKLRFLPGAGPQVEPLLLRRSAN